MASITIRNLDDAVKARLRLRAAQHGRSMEDEAREILRIALAENSQPSGNLAASIRAKFEAFAEFDLPEIPREPLRQPPTFDP
jgi:plasmid stability protein